MTFKFSIKTFKEILTLTIQIKILMVSLLVCLFYLFCLLRHSIDTYNHLYYVIKSKFTCQS